MKFVADRKVLSLRKDIKLRGQTIWIPTAPRTIFFYIYIDSTLKTRKDLG